MNVTELHTLTEWIEREIRSKQVVNAYEALQSVLKSNAQGGAQQSFEEERNRLMEAVTSVDLDTLSREQAEFLDRMEIGPFVGPRALATIEDVLYRNVLDLQTAATKMAEAKAAIERGLEKSDQLREGLEGLVEVGDDFPPEQVLVRVTFAHRASIENVVHLKDWSEAWHEIARGIAMLHDRPPEDVSVVAAGRGSIVVDFSFHVVAIGLTLTAILLRGLKVAERVYDIRIKAEELTNMKLKNEQLARNLERLADEEKEEAATTIADDVLKENRVDRAQEGEKAVALERSVRQLLDFLDKGGNVDVVVPPDETVEEAAEDEATEQFRGAVQQLREMVQELHQLEGRLRELEAGSEGGSDDPND